MTHTWSRQFIFEGRAPDDKDPKGKPPVEGWLTCSTCGAQACQRGWGSSSSVVYRVSARHEWSEEEPECRQAPIIQAPLPGWVEQPNGSWRWSKKRARLSNTEDGGTK